MQALLTALSDWKPMSALVVGDVMLDELVFGDAERLTADAPVPVLHVRQREHRAGGAANVCLNLVAMRSRVSVVGVVGADGAGRVLRETLAGLGVDTGGMIEDEARPTTLKQSLIGLAQHRHAQKMFRVDTEETSPIDGAVRARLLAAFERRVDEADVVLIEDYDKGACPPEVCRAVIERCAELGKPVIVDPARLSDYSRYDGATAVTPNRTEAELATGMRTDHESGDGTVNRRLAARLLERHAFEAVVLTLDRHGALLARRGREAALIPTQAREVYDVTGAGDMVLAGLAAGIAQGLDWPDAVRLANVAAGLEVEIFGVRPIPLEQIHNEVLHLSTEATGKARSLDQVLVQACACRSRGGKVVFTNGCFDIIHVGHTRLLERAASLGDMLVVGLNSDASVRRLKGPERPVNTELDRAQVLSSLSFVDAVVVFDDDTPTRLIEAIRPDVLAKGADYTRDTVVGHEIVESYGGRVELISFVEGKSTSGTIERIKATGPGR